MFTIYLIESSHPKLLKMIEEIHTLKEFKVVGSATNDIEIKRNIGQIVRCDLVIVDESIPGITPVGIMSAVNTETVKKPTGARGIRAIMTTSPSPKTNRHYTDYGYNYVIDKKKPIIEALPELKRLFVEKQNRFANYDKYLTKTIDNTNFHSALTEILHALGIPASLKGYTYLKRAVEIAFLSMDAVVGGITKIIYPTIADYYQTTPSRVERAMRHAIEVGWLRGNIEVIENLFSYSYSSDKGKPTNGEFIANVADYLVVRFRQEQKMLVQQIEEGARKRELESANI